MTGWKKFIKREGDKNGALSTHYGILISLSNHKGSLSAKEQKIKKDQVNTTF